MIKSVTHALMIFKRLLIHLHQRADADHDRVVPLSRWALGTVWPRDVETPLACCRENTGQLISRILRQMSCTQLHMRRVTVLPRFTPND